MAQNETQQPAQQTTLGQQGHGLQPREWVPQRGLDLRSSLALMPADACTIAKNIRWNGTVWTTQKMGWTAVRPNAFGNGAILEQAIHYTTAGNQIYIHQAGNKVQSYDPIAMGTEQLRFTAGSLTAIPCMRSFSPNFFLYVNGVDQPQSWDGAAASFTPMSLWTAGLTLFGVNYTAPKIVELFNNRAAVAGMPQNPYALIITDFGNPNALTSPNPSGDPTFGGIYFVPSQLGPITSLKSLSVSLTSNEQILLIGCKNGFAFVTGTGGNNFTMVAVQSNKWGILSNRAWFVIDTTAYCLCTDGIRPFNGNAYLTNLVSSSLSFPVHPMIIGMSKDQGVQSFVQDNPGELEATFYFCSGSDINNRTALIMNYADINNGLIRFSTKQFPNGASLFSPACGIQFKDSFFAGGYDGILQQTYSGNKYNSVGIDWTMSSPMFAPPTPSQEAQARGYWITQQGDSVLYKARCFAHLVSADETQRLTRTLVHEKDVWFNTDGGTDLGGWVLGVDAFGGAQHNISPFFPPGGGRGQEIELSGNTEDGDINLVEIFSTLIGGGTRQ